MKNGNLITKKEGFLARMRFLTDSEGFLGSLFLFPAIAYIVLLVGIPFVLAIAFSLSDITVGNTDRKFAGLENFRRVIQTPEFLQSLKNTFLFTLVSQAITIVLANILAIVLSSDFRGKWIARLLIMLPWERWVGFGSSIQNSARLTGSCAISIFSDLRTRSWECKIIYIIWATWN